MECRNRGRIPNLSESKAGGVEPYHELSSQKPKTENYELFMFWTMTFYHGLIWKLVSKHTLPGKFVSSTHPGRCSLIPC